MMNVNNHTASSSRIRVMNHNWSATKQRPHLQSVDGISRHSASSEDRIRQCVTSSGSCRKDTDQCLQVAISFYRHRSVPVPCENGSVETTVAEGGQNPVAGLWGRTLRADFAKCSTTYLFVDDGKPSDSQLF